MRLHLDVNKTILVDDKVQGIDAGTSCAQILYWGSWGHRSADGRKWRWDGGEPGGPPPDKDAVLYGNFVRKLPVSRRVKAQLKRDFIKRGQPGARLRPHWERMMEALSYEPAVSQALESLPWAQEVGLDRGAVRLLPSFYRLLLHLQQVAPSASVVLRTYGSDIPEVMVELDAFARGQHPAWPGVKMDGSVAGLDATLTPSDTERFGALHRGGPKGDDFGALALALGTVENPPGRDRPPYPCPLSFFEQHATRLVSGPQKIWEHLEAHRGKVVALRDDYAFWARNRFSTRAGKPLWVSAGQTHEVFFDDNIRHDDPNIIDVRRASDGQPIGAKEALRRHAAWINPYRAVMDEGYLIEVLERTMVSAGFVDGA